MGESCIRGNIMPGDGVYKSTDAGKTWTHVGFTDSDAISKIRIHPTNPDIVFVADVRPATACRATSAASSRRTDGGKTWQKDAVPRRQDRRASTSRSIRSNPNVMFAALWEAYRVEYQMSSGGPGSGLFKSTDGGEHVDRDHPQPGPAARASSARSASRSRAPTRTASTRSSRTRTAGSSAPTTPARRGSW